MLKRRATPPRRPAAPRSSKPPGRGPSGGSGPGKPPGETFPGFHQDIGKARSGRVAQATRPACFAGGSTMKLEFSAAPEIKLNPHAPAGHHRGGGLRRLCQPVR